MNLSTLKKEAREEFRKWFHEVQLSEMTLDTKAWKRNYTAEELPERNHIPAFLDTLIDKVVEAVEESVVPDCIDPNCDNNGTTWHVVMGHDSYGEPAQEQEQAQCQYCHVERFQLLKAFASFKK